MKKNPMMIDEAKMLEDIRAILKLTIEEFVYQMDWPNSKYYDYIKNGRRRPGVEGKKKTHPTIHKVFVGINMAIAQYDNWKAKEKEITKTVMFHLFPSKIKA